MNNTQLDEDEPINNNTSLNSITTTTESQNSTSSLEYLTQSQQPSDSDSDEFLCPECKKGFTSHKGTNKTIQQLIRNNMIACDICNRWYHLLCCSDQLYNSAQTGDLKERVELIFRKSVKAVALNHHDENGTIENDEEMHSNPNSQIEKDITVNSADDANRSISWNENEHSSSNFDMELELRKIESQIQSIPFFICSRCLETRNLYNIANTILHSSEEDHSVKTIPYFQDEIRDPFLFFEKYSLQDELEQDTSSTEKKSSNVYYIITKANNEDQIRRFSYCNFLATREDARFIATSKVTFQQMVECSKRNIQNSIKKSLELLLSHYYNGTMEDENSFNSQSSELASPSPSSSATTTITETPNNTKFSPMSYQHHLLDIIKEKALESCIRPENEAFILLRVQVQNGTQHSSDKEGHQQNVNHSSITNNNTCECIGYFTCYFEFLSKTVKKYTLTDVHSTFKQLFITPKYRKKGHAQRMVKFFLTLSSLLLDTSKIEGYRYFSSHTSIEYPNYSMCSLLERLDMNVVKRIQLFFDWNDLDRVKEQKNMSAFTRRKSKSNLDEILIEEAQSNSSSEHSYMSDSDEDHSHEHSSPLKRKLETFVNSSGSENEIQQDEIAMKKRKFHASCEEFEEHGHTDHERQPISSDSIIKKNKTKRNIRHRKRDIILLAKEHLEKMTGLHNTKKSIIAFLFKTKRSEQEESVTNVAITPTFRLEIFLPLHSFNFDLIDEKEFKVEFM
ncbi:hypothetical protein C9374_008296 [Naegleria lovaniensis]|uniref:Uncharacterized protein n=1 Tax=Naegleria lovaniensis TaxID=51637 RepID=A0AA88KFV0_NAELO|nr:uncharacterized protein C9374_008296 [Naegleria lovaniensis]KAG2378657.1 hypothetical protein C9374_008296 [Naegleria lovaniensis]